MHGFARVVYVEANYFGVRYLVQTAAKGFFRSKPPFFAGGCLLNCYSGCA